MWTVFGEVKVDKVTPGKGVEERTYEYDGGDIICYSIEDRKELFRVSLSQEHAKFLMEDLYFGEYTGA